MIRQAKQTESKSGFDWSLMQQSEWITQLDYVKFDGCIWRNQMEKERKNESLWNVNELEWIGLASKKRFVGAQWAGDWLLNEWFVATNNLN